MSIIDSAKVYGCHDLVPLKGEPTHRHLDYLDLIKNFGDGSPRVEAVAEFQATPLLYIVSEEQLGNSDHSRLMNLQHMLANRGEKAFLGILSPGQLTVYPVNLDRSVLAKDNKKIIKQDSPEAPLLFQSIATGVFTLEGQPEDADYVYNTIHKLMTKSSEELIKDHHLHPLDVLSFLGRALFLRFLWDRRIIRQDELHTISPKAASLGECFHDVENSIATCCWLDDTFNGDLLPFSDDYPAVFKQANIQTQGKLFLHLQAILMGWEHAGSGVFQEQIDWGDLDFAHIPIGVLSQVYENFSKIWDSRQREQISAYYTPKGIARYLVDDAFEGLANKRDAHILDPSCGAGIFLVLAFRKLVAARWEHDGKRPDTKTIQTILYKQLCGFDVSESALRLAALSLYITAIELNGTTRPPKSLRFPKPLQGCVLYNHRRPEEHEIKDFVLGSLRPDLSEAFNGRFDMVIGNPPWSRLRADENNKESKEYHQALAAKFTKMSRRIIAARGLGDKAKAYNNPDNNPDLPFVWRSTEWVKPEGIIAMVLPGRIFLKQTPSGIRAFNLILEGIEITGILNGSNLSDTEVWPGMNQPFMLFFARNRRPGENHNFHFVTPHFEKNLNDKGRIRIDYQSAQPVGISGIKEKPSLLKTLAVGTSLDVEVINKLDELKWPTVKKYWESNGLYSGLGYNRSPEQQQGDASFMYDLPDFIPPAHGEFMIDMQSLSRFTSPSAHMPRCIKLYTPPLIIVPEAPGSLHSSPRSWIARETVVFKKSYYGFSADGSKDADVVIAVLYLITHSDLFRYYVLIKSSRVGAERRTFLKKDLEDFPFPEIELLSLAQRQEVKKLSHQLESSATKPWAAINNYIYNLYGLDEYDRQVIKDTLEVAQPFKEFRDRANGAPNGKERKAFRAELHKFIAPYFAVTNERIRIEELEIPRDFSEAPWYFFVISIGPSVVDTTQTEMKNIIQKITEEANRSGCSRVIMPATSNLLKRYLLVGVIGQYRYWTLSRARLCAMDIIRHHLDAFPITRQS